MAEPNGLARSSRYSGVAGGCPLETKARDKAVVTDGIKEMEELVYISLCRGRGWHHSGLPEMLPRVAAKPARPCTALARCPSPVEKRHTRNTQLGRGSFGEESGGKEEMREEGMTACCAETAVGFRF